MLAFTGMFIQIFGALILLTILYLLFNAFRLTSYKGNSEKQLSDDIDSCTAAKRLGKAIEFCTVSTQHKKLFDETPFIRLHAFLEEAFPHCHQHLKKETVNRCSLLYSWEGSSPELKPIMLTSHIDVVPVEPGTEASWLHPPFSGAIDNGYIWGRGAMDIKSGVMAIFEAVETLIKSGHTPNRTIILAFGHDEEIDGKYGAMEIGKRLKKRGVELLYLLDEGTPIVHDAIPGLDTPAALVAVAEKGYVSVKLGARGSGGHSSVPRGLTPAAILGNAVYTLERNPMKSRVDTLLKATVEAIGPQMPFIYRVVMANMWLFKWLVKWELSKMPATKAALGTTVATTIFSSGVKENVLPVNAEAVANFRIHPNDSIQKVMDHVKRLFKHKSITVEEMDGAINPSRVSDVNDPSYRALMETIQDVFPEVIVAPTLMVGATDARHYTGLTNNVYRFTPLRATEDDLDRVHGTNERLAIDNYREMILFYLQLIKKTSHAN